MWNGYVVRSQIDLGIGSTPSGYIFISNSSPWGFYTPTQIVDMRYTREAWNIVREVELGGRYVTE